MVILGNEKVPKSSAEFRCETCDYSTSRKSQYDRHLLTAKHQNGKNGNSLVPKVPTENICHCGKIYVHQSALSRHKKVCISGTDISQNYILQILKEVVITQKQNSDLQQTILEQQSKIIELSNKPMIQNTMCNNNNKHITINMFLNEQCKDAITFQEFLNTIKPSMEEVLRLTETGDKEGISKIITNALGQLEITERPMHCTDLKRHTTYIKNQEGWDKEQDQKSAKRVYNKALQGCFQQLSAIWEKNPNYSIPGTEEYEQKAKMITELGKWGSQEENVIKNLETNIRLEKVKDSAAD
jgi:hypothetical protein